MRYNKLILPIVLALLVLPVAAAPGAAAPATQSGVQGFKILLSDGSSLNGAVSFTLSIATQYGQLTLPSTDFVSADFDSINGWADIRTKSVALRVQYKPEESALQATTEVGAVIADLTKVASITALYAEAPNWVPPEASLPYDEGGQALASLSDIYSQPATLMDLPPYEYGAEAPYYWPPDYPTEPYCYTDDYPYFWEPDFGFGFIGFSNFGHGFDFNRHHEGFSGRFDHEGSGVIWSGNGVWRSDGASARQFDGTADPKPMTSGRTFSSPTFRSESTPSYFYTSAPTYRSSGTRSFYSGGMRFGGGFSHGGGFGGGFGGHGGGGHGR